MGPIWGTSNLMQIYGFYLRYFPLIVHEVWVGETNIFAPENRPKPNRKGSYSNHPFFRGENVSFREGNMCDRV